MSAAQPQRRNLGGSFLPLEVPSTSRLNSCSLRLSPHSQSSPTRCFPNQSFSAQISSFSRSVPIFSRQPLNALFQLIDRCIGSKVWIVMKVCVKLAHPVLFFAASFVSLPSLVSGRQRASRSIARVRRLCEYGAKHIQKTNLGRINIHLFSLQLLFFSGSRRCH
jgi:hypothetical protein